MAHIRIRELAGNVFLQDFTQQERENILYYMLNERSIVISCGRCDDYISADDIVMHSNAFGSNDGMYSWNVDDFYAIRENKQALPMEFVKHIDAFYESGGTVYPQDDCWKFGLRRMRYEFPQTEEGTFAFEKQLADINDFCLHHSEYCPYPKASSDSDESVID